jgi:hypothetical protein
LLTESPPKVVQGRPIGVPELALIRGWLQAHPSWNRTRLSRELCVAWNWRNGVGELKDMACRTLLLKLEAQGQIVLPPRRIPSINARRNRRVVEVAHDQSPIQGALAALRPLQIQALASGDDALALFRFLLARYHYLGLGNCVGQNLKYLVRDRSGRPLAVLLFGSAAWQTRPRDLWIGWNTEQRLAHLPLVANNARFLILPWVKVPHLASHLLGQLAARLSSDWQAKYGHPIHLLETFVEQTRFRGTCYRAAGWHRGGVSSGRSRNDIHSTLQVPTKEIYLQPLVRDFRRRLTT